MAVAAVAVLERHLSLPGSSRAWRWLGPCHCHSMEISGRRRSSASSPLSSWSTHRPSVSLFVVL